MDGIVIIVAFVGLLAAGIVENAQHARRISSFRIRVNVNGTRGKSTVTRLIAAGLRQAGIRTVAKTTGTAPRLILPDGSEEEIRRRGRARISEHVRIAKRAAAEKAEALVVECMALEAENQHVYEHRLVRSTIGVMTNIRPDHLDVMGPGIEDVARTLAITVPDKAHFVAPDGYGLDILTAECQRKGTVLHVAHGYDVSEEELAGFGYTSFAENVAIALKACEVAGVDRNTAFAGMLKAKPDPGVSPLVEVSAFGRRMMIVNAFAANDVESTRLMWESFAKPRIGAYDRQVLVISNREDRPQRVWEMSKLAAELPVDEVLYIGGMQKLAKLLGRGRGRMAGEAGAEEVLGMIAGFAQEGGSLLVLLAGNTKGAGAELTKLVDTFAGGGRA